jgi:hypothetical protein
MLAVESAPGASAAIIHPETGIDDFFAFINRLLRPFYDSLDIEA